MLFTGSVALKATYLQHNQHFAKYSLMSEGKTWSIMHSPTPGQWEQDLTLFPTPTYITGLPHGGTSHLSKTRSNMFSFKLSDQFYQINLELVVHSELLYSEPGTI